MLKFSTFSFTLVMLISLLFTSSFAQIDMPQPSPAAMVKQTVGLTDVTIEYSSPAMRGRTVFGELVPYGEVWRTGANKATAITFSDAVTIEGTKVEAGTYSLFTIPNEDKWTVIINKNAEQWGAGKYDEAEDVVRVEVKPTKLFAPSERMLFMIEAVEDDAAKISLLWSDTKISFMANVNAVEKVVSNIKTTLDQAENLWYTYAQSAEYYLENEQNLEQAQDWIEKSISLKDHYYNNWVKARILVARNNTAGVSSSAGTAVKLAQKAIEMGDKENTNFYKRLKPQIEQFIKTYSNQIPKMKENKK